MDFDIFHPISYLNSSNYLFITFNIYKSFKFSILCIKMLIRNILNCLILFDLIIILNVIFFDWIFSFSGQVRLVRSGGLGPFEVSVNTSGEPFEGSDDEDNWRGYRRVRTPPSPRGLMIRKFLFLVTNFILL